jgi:hypothetical protein
VIDSPVTTKPEKAVEVLGWDPYEVWRTRVRVPQTSDHTTPLDPPAKPRLVHKG